MRAWTACARATASSGYCAIENSTKPGSGPQLTALGYTGDDFTECGGCMTQCMTDAVQSADEAVLTCMKMAADTSECGGGVDGVMPLVNAVIPAAKATPPIVCVPTSARRPIRWWFKPDCFPAAKRMSSRSSTGLLIDTLVVCTEPLDIWGYAPVPHTTATNLDTWVILSKGIVIDAFFSLAHTWLGAVVISHCRRHYR